MHKEAHVLNGDALLSQLQGWLSGDLIVARECLVDGPVDAPLLDDFFHQRARFLSKSYGGTEISYWESVVPEFTKLKQLDPGCVLNLWFEEDLFCQVNLWFVAHLIKPRVEQVYLVRPEASLRYGFGGLDKEALKNAYQNRILLSAENLEAFSGLWEAYIRADATQLKAQIPFVEHVFPRIGEAIEAQIARSSGFSNENSPEALLKAIRDELSTDQFGPAFKAFSDRAPIYGFGDLQVKRLWDALLDR